MEGFRNAVLRDLDGFGVIGSQRAIFETRTEEVDDS